MILSYPEYVRLPQRGQLRIRFEYGGMGEFGIARGAELV